MYGSFCKVYATETVCICLISLGVEKWILTKVRNYVVSSQWC